jgi:xylulokinase
MKKLLTLDVGTTAVKIGLFLENLTPLAFVINEYLLITPQSDVVEMDPDVYWKNTVQGIREVLKKTGTLMEEVACITCTTQGETFVPVGADGRHLYNAIVWLDSRAKEEAELIAKRYNPEIFYKKTGLPEVNAYCPIAKLLWLKNKYPKVYENAEKILLLEDYLIFRFCGEYATNPALMCSTGYFDIIENQTWHEALEAFGLDTSKIPPVYPCGTIVGSLSEKTATELGLKTDTKIVTGAMDQVASAIGSGNIEEGILQDSTGTCLAVAATATKLELGRWSPVTVYSHGVEGKYLLIMISQTAGIILKWFRNEFCRDIVAACGDAAFQEMSVLAASVPPLSKGVSLYPHFTGVQMPKPDELARGVFFGIGLDAGRECFIRAIMEGVGYMLRESIELMRLNPEHIISLGGGSKSDVWCQIKADILGKKIAVMKTEESASLGAAMLGGVACGLFKDIKDAAAMLEQKKEYFPEKNACRLYEKGYARYQMLYESFKPLYRT